MKKILIISIFLFSVLAVFLHLKIQNIKNSPLDYEPVVSNILAGTSEPNIPIAITVDNYLKYENDLAGLGPFTVYAMATDPSIDMYDLRLKQLESVTDRSVGKYIVFSSWRTLESKLSQPRHSEYLKSIGIKSIMYNSEGGLTPQDELDHILDTDLTKNSVVAFAIVAKKYGFSTGWATLRVQADKVSDSLLSSFYKAGLEDVGFQEQKFIEISCVLDRVREIKTSVSRYQKAANGLPTSFVVQLMPSRCVNGDIYAVANCDLNKEYDYQHCSQFVGDISALVDRVSIWANGDDVQNIVPMVKAFRGSTPASTPLPDSKEVITVQKAVLQSPTLLKWKLNPALLIVRATSSHQPNVQLKVVDYDELKYNAKNHYYEGSFVTFKKPTSITVVSSKGATVTVPVISSE